MFCVFQQFKEKNIDELSSRETYRIKRNWHFWHIFKDLFAFQISVFTPYGKKRIIPVGHMKREDSCILLHLVKATWTVPFLVPLRLDLRKCSKICFHHAGLKDSWRMWKPQEADSCQAEAYPESMPCSSPIICTNHKVHRRIINTLQYSLQ